MDIALTGVRLAILVCSAIALRFQWKQKARRSRSDETALALVSSPELRLAGCQFLCVPSATAAETASGKQTAAPRPRPSTTTESRSRTVKIVGASRSAAASSARPRTVLHPASAIDGGVVLLMSDRSLRVTARLPLRKM